MSDQRGGIPTGIKVPLAVDLVVILTLAAQWGSNSKRMDYFEAQIRELKQAQVTETRVVRIEEQQKYLVQRVDETNRLLREYIDEQRQQRQGRR